MALSGMPGPNNGFGLGDGDGLVSKLCARLGPLQRRHDLARDITKASLNRFRAIIAVQSGALAGKAQQQALQGYRLENLL